jgi:hypothetical protein
VTLPASSGSVVIRDVTDCGGTWYAVGGVLGPGDATRPAAWTSTDGRTWRSVVFAPLATSLYGPQNVIYSVGCAAGRVVMIGSKPGGAHGIPRISTWHSRADGAMAEVFAPFDTYGGDNGVDAERVAGGPDGFLIAGNRTSGAAVWLSSDGATFRLFEKVPGLASTATERTAAHDAVAGPDGSWVVVGGRAPTVSPNQAPAAWTTRDGTAVTPVAVPGPAGFDELQRVVRLGDDVIAAGLRGDRVGAWREHAGTWTQAGAFDGHAIQALTAAGDDLYAAADAHVWRSGDHGDSWRRYDTPAGAAAPMTLAGRTGGLLLASGGRMWTTAE